MTPAARTQAAIELLDQIIEAARTGGAAADTLAQRFFAGRRYAGSKDRRAIRTLAYDAIRRFGEVPPSGRAAVVALAEGDADLAATFDGSGYGPAPIAADETRAVAGTAPAWLTDLLHASGIPADALPTMLERAPLDIRVNRLRARVDAVQAEIGGERVPRLTDALRFTGDTALEQTAAFQGGAFEVQDAGSQLVSQACGAASAMTVVDLCAGGGGKTLALAAAMANDGRIVATDTNRARLSNLSPRAERAGVSIVETRLLDPGREAAALADLDGVADIVLVDAPCSGTGTWRRNPEARWRLTPDALARLVDTQARLLDIGARLVRPGGVLVHVVCSLLDAEGADQATAFLRRHPGWSAVPLELPLGSVHGPGMRLTPATDRTDGFFLAKLTRP